MRVVRLGVSVGLWTPGSPTMSTTFEFTSQFPVPARIRTVPPRRMARSLSRKNVIGVLYRAKSLISDPFRKVRGSTVGGIWVVHPNEFIIFRKETLENVSPREAGVTFIRRTHI